MDPARELRALEVDWPPTPELRLVLEPLRRRSRRPLFAAVALALVALAAAFAVPQSRGAILRFLHLGGESVQFVETLPPASVSPDRADDATTTVAQQLEHGADSTTVVAAQSDRTDDSTTLVLPLTEGAAPGGLDRDDVARFYRDFGGPGQQL